MKNEKIKEFLTKIAQEEGFKVEFLKFKEKVEKKGFSKKDNEKLISECLLPWSKKLGYKLTKKDFIDFDRTQKPTEITGLSPAELENVSGGGFTMLFALFAMFGSALAGGIGGGDSTNKNQKKGQDSFSTSLTQYQQADGGETTLAMLRDGHKIGDIILDAYMQSDDDEIPSSAAENANFKAFGTQAEQSGGSGQVSIYTGLDSSGNAFSAAPAGGESMSKALVTTSGHPQTSVNDYNKHFARSSAAVDSGENVVQMLKDIKNPKAPSDTPNTDIEPQVGLNPSPELLSGTPADAPPYQRGQVSIYTGLDASGHPYSSAQKVNPKVTSGSTATQNGQSWNDFAKEAAKATAGSFGIAAGLGAAAIGSVYAAGAAASELSGDGAQQKTTDKTKETSKKTEEKTSTKETTKDGSNFMRSFMETLQKNSPEARKYLESLE